MLGLIIAIYALLAVYPLDLAGRERAVVFLVIFLATWLVVQSMPPCFLTFARYLVERTREAGENLYDLGSW